MRTTHGIGVESRSVVTVYSATPDFKKRTSLLRKQEKTA
jgi:hypothetical protein